VKLPILAGAYRSRSVNAAEDRCINLYPEITATGAKEPGVLHGCPGLRAVAAFTDGPVQGLKTANSLLYVVSGGVLYSVDTSWVKTTIGNVGTLDRVTMADNGLQLIISSGYIYTYATSTLAAIADVDWPGGDVQFMDGYFLANVPGTGRIQISALYDGTSWDSLDFTTAEGFPDNVVGHIADHREWWVFGDKSIEVYYNSGNADFPFERINGAVIEQGCSAAASIQKLDNSVFWLGHNDQGGGVVWKARGYTPERISTHAIEYAIAQWETLSDAYAWTYTQEGHAFYALSSPSADETWVFDAATGLWHQRATFTDSVYSTGVFTRHRANCVTAFNDKIVIGDHTDGRIYVFDMDRYQDNMTVRKWLRSVRSPHAEGRRVRYNRLQLDMETGHGLTFGQGSNPQVMMRYSDDGGHTWSSEHWVSSGRIGKYKARAQWWRLGMGRDRVFEFSGTDAVKIAIVGAYLDADPGMS